MILCRSAFPTMPPDALRWSLTLCLMAGLLAPRLALAQQEPTSGAALIEHARSGRVPAAARALDAGADPDTQDADGRTALMMASARGYTDLARTLLEAGADPNLRSTTGWTALMEAADEGHTTLAYGLLENGADPDLTLPSGEREGWTALMLAARAGNAETTGVLLDAGAAPDHRSAEGRTALAVAYEFGRFDAAQRAVFATLLDAGADPNVETVGRGFVARRSPLLHHALSSNNEEAVRLLIEHGVDLDRAATDDSDSALGIAIRQGTTAMLRTLLDAGADPDAPTSTQGRTPLMVAADRDAPHAARLLLEAGADVNRTDESGTTPLMLAADEEQLALTRLFLDYGAEANARDRDGRTALMYLMNYPDCDLANHCQAIAETLIAAGTDPTLRSQRGDTALDRAAEARSLESLAQLLRAVVYESDAPASDPAARDDATALARAAANGDYGAVERLLKAGVDPDVRFDTTLVYDEIDDITIGDATPLYLALTFEHPLAARALLDAGADPNLPTDRGATPFMAAAWRGDAGTMQRLEAAGARVLGQTTDGWTVLMGAGDGNPRIVRRLLNADADPNARTGGNMTALLVAAQRGFEVATGVLLEAGATPNVQDTSGMTPLMYAAHGSHAGIAERLLQAGADPDLKNNEGRAALEIAQNSYDAERVVQLLRQRGATDQQAVAAAVERAAARQAEAERAAARQQVVRERRTEVAAPPPLPAPPPPPAPSPEPELGDEEVFSVVEQQPELVGGMAGLQSHVNYPDLAHKAGIEGRVFVQFIVTKRGLPTDLVVLRSPHQLLSEEAIRVISQARFTPGMQRGRPVNVRMSLPVTFRLN